MNLFLESILSAFRRGWKNMRAVCGLPTCQNTMLMRILPQSRVGIRVREAWYCSVDCFSEAARARLSVLSGERVSELQHTPRRSLGLLMLSKGYLTSDQLQLAVAQSQLQDEQLEVTLLRLGFVNARQLAAARAAQWGYPVPGQELMGQPVAADIPSTLLRTYSAVPLYYSMTAKRLLLGFVYRVDHSLLHSLQQVTGCRVEPCFVTSTELSEQMARLSAVPDWREVVLEDPLTPAQMARTLGGFAVEVQAIEASFTLCRNYIWVRLSGKRRKIDVLFRARD
jgi:Type II secretion system (T2SS), protein E, N-terminal domain